MGWEKDLGTVEEGKIADLVVIKGNPIDDISILRNPDSILFVMKGGQLYKKMRICNTWAKKILVPAASLIHQKNGNRHHLSQMVELKP